MATACMPRAARPIGQPKRRPHASRLESHASASDIRAVRGDAHVHVKGNGEHLDDNPPPYDPYQLTQPSQEESACVAFMLAATANTKA